MSDEYTIRGRQTQSRFSEEQRKWDAERRALEADVEAVKREVQDLRIAAAKERGKADRFESMYDEALRERDEAKAMHGSNIEIHLREMERWKAERQSIADVLERWLVLSPRDKSPEWEDLHQETLVLRGQLRQGVEAERNKRNTTTRQGSQCQAQAESEC